MLSSRVAFASRCFPKSHCQVVKSVLGATFSASRGAFPASSPTIRGPGADARLVREPLGCAPRGGPQPSVDLQHILVRALRATVSFVLQQAMARSMTAASGNVEVHGSKSRRRSGAFLARHSCPPRLRTLILHGSQDGRRGGGAPPGGHLWKGEAPRRRQPGAPARLGFGGPKKEGGVTLVVIDASALRGDREGDGRRGRKRDGSLGGSRLYESDVDGQTELSMSAP